ncbi:hypothetical protein SBA6_370003 [Candidatus Sulfopaludibacter sp. SbA6]|nr:hypothetical protein SBA6_370003 [Candidatus Sulfopaludibacter sp. SbA6]
MAVRTARRLVTGQERGHRHDGLEIAGAAEDQRRNRRGDGSARLEFGYLPEPGAENALDVGFAVPLLQASGFRTQGCARHVLPDMGSRKPGLERGEEPTCLTLYKGVVAEPRWRIRH